MISQKELKRRFSYDPLVGDFRHLTAIRNKPVGAIAGNRCDGYIIMAIDGVKYKAHRLAWLYFYGDWPKGDIDHIDGDRSNNAIENLREASRSQNLANQGKNRRGTSKYKGVCFDKNRGKWSAHISFQRKHLALGRFETEEMAAKAYADKAVELFGEFARSA